MKNEMLEMVGGIHTINEVISLLAQVQCMQSYSLWYESKAYFNVVSHIGENLFPLQMCLSLFEKISLPGCYVFWYVFDHSLCILYTMYRVDMLDAVLVQNISINLKFVTSTFYVQKANIYSVSFTVPFRSTIGSYPIQLHIIQQMDFRRIPIAYTLDILCYLSKINNNSK